MAVKIPYLGAVQCEVAQERQRTLSPPHMVLPSQLSSSSSLHHTDFISERDSTLQNILDCFYGDGRPTLVENPRRDAKTLGEMSWSPLLLRSSTTMRDNG